jgi:hypothetical protein
MRPGDNNIPVSTMVDKLAFLGSRDLVTGLVIVSIKGNSSVYNSKYTMYYISRYLSVWRPMLNRQL